MNKQYIIKRSIGIAIITLFSVFFVSTLLIQKSDILTLKYNASMLHPLAIFLWIGYLLRSIFGKAAYIFIILGLLCGSSFLSKRFRLKLTILIPDLIVMLVAASTLFAMISSDITQFAGGYVGIFLSTILKKHIMLSIVYSFVSLVILLTLIIAVIDTILSIKSFLQLQRVPLKKANLMVNITTENKNRFKRDLKIPWVMKKRILIYESEMDPVTTIGKNDITHYKPLIPLLNINLLTEKRLPPMLDNNPIMENKAEDKDDITITIQHSEPEIVVQEPSEEKYIQKSDDTQVSSLDNDPLRSAPPLSDTAAFNTIEPIITDTAEESYYTNNSDPVIFDSIKLEKDYAIPVEYLQSSLPPDSESWNSEIQKNSVLLVNTLSDFGIESRVINVHRGPVISLYEMQIAPGIKVNRIVNLADDIAMALAAYRVRIVAPIPGKSAIGVEIPNKIRESVTLGDIIKTQDYRTRHGNLVVAIGKDILGKPVMLDIKNQPHLLIAGATGSGKSVCVNTIITSLIYSYDPNYIKFILVDPKMVELQLYNGLPHLLTPVITEPHIAPLALKWALQEMERRYHLLSGMNTRDIERYNDIVMKSGHEDQRLPYIITVIDELADLMMVASKDVETYITRISQKARAVGIHLIIATQRPSVDIITGIIKANFPARIAFQVAQKTDSRTIIDQNGAEKLLGKGDMLYLSPTSSYPIRIQGGFISEDEILHVVSHCKKLGKPSYINIEDVSLLDDGNTATDSAEDELFIEALKIVEETKKASASYLQRRLSIGYNRAARIIEQMEEMGYIGSQHGSKPREVFI